LNPPLYADTSGLAKLILHEVEGPALKAYLRDREFTLVSSELIEVELVRAVSRADIGLVSYAKSMVEGLILLPITGSVRRTAGEIFPGRIKSLDAIHLSTALEIKTDLAGLLTYDSRMAALAEESGIEALRPT
jgi:predicted nucleic acid-binding protein